ncbi:FYVE and coiled-coil domain-containing protein 1 [Bulinus truncatus]|nr:FYVE and coiled-coil domain-containing protein 1 [Bulinus truncatus]
MKTFIRALALGNIGVTDWEFPPYIHEYYTIFCYSTVSMAAAAQFPLAADASQKVPLSMQKKIFQDVLDCIVQLKADFFESHQPITDDSVVLQRFCAKFEHLIQVGMKGYKVSLLGRKKDYWDYFSECLASAKGSNDGIKYVRSLGENKSSLGKGRAFIRFCLVHQRLADTLQQCIVHDKTQGFDLDAAWPSFANRKHGGSGSWNVPLSRRSSITSMDAISQISVSIDTSEVDRLTKDLESVQSMKSELIDQIGVLQQEKDQVNQSAWTAQGEVQALDQQLLLLRSELASLQDKYKNLDADLHRQKSCQMVGLHMSQGFLAPTPDPPPSLLFQCLTPGIGRDVCLSSFNPEWSL